MLKSPLTSVLKKQPVKKIWGKILGLAWLKFTVAALQYGRRGRLIGETKGPPLSVHRSLASAALQMNTHARIRRPH